MQRSSAPVFGYFSTLQTIEFGYFGGYLVVNALGRPLEFHCTAPVRPSRAQEILYGPTLESYLLGEQIGRALLDEAKLKPDIILTDQPAAFALRSSLVYPIVLVSNPHNQATEQSVRLHRNDARHPVRDFCIGPYEVGLPVEFESDRQRATELLELLAQHVELDEPFSRIHDAIREASRIGQREQETHDPIAA